MAEVQFALSPALIHNGVIDYGTTIGAKQYYEAVKTVHEEGFGVESEGIISFLAKIKTRAQRSGWKDILTIPEDHLQPNTNLRNLIDGYGEITLKQVQDHASTYSTMDNRQSQNSAQLYHCLLNSLSEEGLSKINIWEDQFNENGSVLLKVIIWEISLDTNATVRNIRQKLSSLDTYLPTIGHDITKLNLYVKELMQRLSARGETTQDLLVNLFKGYASASDNTFT